MSKKTFGCRSPEWGQSAGRAADEQDICLLAGSEDRGELVTDVNAKLHRDALPGRDFPRQPGELRPCVGHARAHQHFLLDEATQATILHRLDDMKQRQAGMSLRREHRCLSHGVDGTFRKGSGDQDSINGVHEVPTRPIQHGERGSQGWPRRGQNAA